jgi:hypothetical protein
MPNLLSGSTLRTGGSGDFINLADAMPQLPATETTLTGFTIATDSVLRTTYRSSLGFVEFTTGSMYSALPEGTVRVLATGTAYSSTSTMTGTLVVQGGVGIGANLYVEDDIVVNRITIGRGHEGYNNIVIKGTAEANPNDFSNGQESIAIGYSTLDGLATSYKDIAIGRHALSSGTEVRNSIAIGDSALKNLGVLDAEYISTITNITVNPILNITTATTTNPATLQMSAAHNLSTGTKIYITGVIGFNTGSTSILNGQNFWVDVISPGILALYKNSALTNSLDATSATTYITGGDVRRPILIESPDYQLTTGTKIIVSAVQGMTELNGGYYWVEPVSTSSFGIYIDSILNVPVDGDGFAAYITSGTISRTYIRDRNIAIGTDAAKSLIDGENNFFFGDRVAQNLTTGSNNFIFGHQVASNLIRGNGIIAIGADNIVDGVDDQINIGSVFYYNGTGTSTINADTEVGLGTESTSSTSGAFRVVGGAGVQGSLYVGNELHVTSSTVLTGDLLPGTTTTNIGSASNPFNSLYLKGSTLYLSTVTLKSANSLDFKVESTAGYVTQTVGNLYLNSNAPSINVGSGALVVTGGAGISGSVNIEGELNVEGTGQVSLSPAGASVIIKPTAGGSVEIRPASEGAIDNMIIGANDAAAAHVTTAEVLSTTSATSTTTGALTVAGGVGILGDVYSASGNPDENFLLHTPRTFITNIVAPTGAKVGDWWIDTSGPYFLHNIRNGTSTVWVQVGAV